MGFDKVTSGPDPKKSVATLLDPGDGGPMDCPVCPELQRYVLQDFHASTSSWQCQLWYSSGSIVGEGLGTRSAGCWMTWRDENEISRDWFYTIFNIWLSCEDMTPKSENNDYNLSCPRSFWHALTREYSWMPQQKNQNCLPWRLSSSALRVMCLLPSLQCPCVRAPSWLRCMQIRRLAWMPWRRRWTARKAALRRCRRRSMLWAVEVPEDSI